MRHTAVILAAGLGRRLGVPDGLPKWLAPVGSVTPAAMHLEACAKAPTITEVKVVAGHGLAAVEAAIEPWRQALEVEVVFNPRYDDLNNWYSLLVGLRACGPGGDGFFVVNSDLCAPVSWFSGLFETLPGAPGEVAIAVDFERPLTDEAMKVTANGEGRVGQIAKTGLGDRGGLGDPLGEYVGLAYLNPPAAEGLIGVLASFEGEERHADAWYEHGFQAHIDAGATYVAAPVPDSEWVEIDDPADLAAAVTMMETA